MKVDFKKLTATTLSVAVLASLSGCAMLDKDDDAVLEVAEDYATAITKLKAADIVSLIAEPEDDLEDTINIIVNHDADLYGEAYDRIFGAIEGTLAYEIDEESVESSKKAGEASVDIIFTLVDYQAVYDDLDEGADLDAFVDALGSGDTQEIKVSVDFVLEDDEWLVDDSQAEAAQKVYAFYEDAFDFEFGTAISPDAIDYIEWYYSNDGVYTDVTTIELDIIPTEEAQEIEWEFWYEYYLDGALIFTSDICTDQGYWIESYYGPSYDSAAATENGYLVAGSYECIVYDTAGNVLADSTCTVENGGGSSVVVPTIGGGDADTWINGVDQYWYSYSDGAGYAMGEGDYSTSETVIEFTCQVNDEANLAYFPVYYEVYYSATGSLDDAEEVYSATITPSEYTNGYFYEFQYVENGGLDAGSYFFLGATDATGSEMLFSVEATVS